MKKEDVRYLNFPTCLLKELFIDKEKALANILYYSVYKHSRGLEYGTELEKFEASANYLRVTFGDIEWGLEKGSKLFNKLEKNSNNLFNTSLNTEIYWNFRKNNKTEFDIMCLCAFCSIRSILGSKEYWKTNKSLILNRVFELSDTDEVEGEIFESPKQAAEYLSRVFNIDDIDYGIISGALTSGKLKKSTLTATASKNKKEYIIYKDEVIEYFREYTKSPYGNRWANKVTLYDLYKQYSKRYQFDKFMLELQLSWGLKTYSHHVRGFYVSFAYEINELALACEKAKKKSKEKALSERKKEARELALKRINEQH